MNQEWKMHKKASDRERKIEKRSKYEVNKREEKKQRKVPFLCYQQNLY